MRCASAPLFKLPQQRRENLQYLVGDAQGHPLACVLFGAAAWQCASRDRYIEWDGAARAQHLHLIANNSRFLILPWVRVPQLASHVLGRIARRLSVTGSQVWPSHLSAGNLCAARALYGHRLPGRQLGARGPKPRAELARIGPTAPGTMLPSKTFTFTLAPAISPIPAGPNTRSTPMTTTTPLANTTAEPSRQVRRARTRKAARVAARSTPEAQTRQLTEAILDAASVRAAAPAQAQALGKAQLAEAEVQAWLKDMDARLDVIFAIRNRTWRDRRTVSTTAHLALAPTAGMR